MLEMSSLLAGAKLLPKKGSASLTKAGLVALMRNALDPEAAGDLEAQQVGCHIPAPLVKQSMHCPHLMDVMTSAYCPRIYLTYRETQRLAFCYLARLFSRSGKTC